MLTGRCLVVFVYVHGRVSVGLSIYLSVCMSVYPSVCRLCLYVYLLAGEA